MANSWLGAQFGNVYNNGVEVDLAGGLNFYSGLRAVYNTSTKVVDIRLDESTFALPPLLSLGSPLDVLRINAGGTATEWHALEHDELVGHDHTQYLLVDGSRAMSGDLDMGDNDIANIGAADASSLVTAYLKVSEGQLLSAATGSLYYDNGGTPEAITWGSHHELVLTGPETIDEAEGGTLGQVVLVRVSGDTATFTHAIGADLFRCPRGVDVVLAPGDCMLMIHDGTQWSILSVCSVSGDIDLDGNDLNNVANASIDALTSQTITLTDDKAIKSHYTAVQDDTAIEIAANCTGLLLFWTNGILSVPSGIVSFRATSTYQGIQKCGVSDPMTTFNIVTGNSVLSGTTGPDTKFNISAGGTSLYIENRLGVFVNLYYILIRGL